eukprot:TRINITY_DN5157_c1_g4_i1.p1 TRINITY_DN5157_c1_g4~~TRINITY_DN5157_c1_g4_i1.p1  ORF type:complete len:423 (+),score=95.76 TRINITY_DN5157_c1_g4_i1:60-1271(+)
MGFLTWVVLAAAVIAALMAQNEMRRVEQYDPSRAFSESYWEARDKFRRGVEKVQGMDLTTIPIAEGSAYTIDIGLIKGEVSPEQGGELVLHFSGVHGVEGYAGSGVQVKLLEQWAASPPKKTTVLIHAFNPYGMAHFRRWNENNVDLNRNGLYDLADFERLKARDFNVVGYGDFDHLFNPPHAPSLADPFRILAIAAKALYNHGLEGLKLSLVAAQYQKPTGIFFGGTELQASYKILRSYLEGKNLHKATGKVTQIDVHTGLGPEGVDTLLVDDGEIAKKVRERFPVSPVTDPLTKVEALDGSEKNSQAAGGYELTEGFTSHALRKIFTSASEKHFITQEFGTVHGLFVARALILENMAYHFDPEFQPYWAEYTRDAFYVRKPEWKSSIVRRGVELMRQAQVF